LKKAGGWQFAKPFGLKMAKEVETRKVEKGRRLADCKKNEKVFIPFYLFCGFKKTIQ